MNLYSKEFKLISIGNRKIAKNTMIFSCTSYKNCPSKQLELCSVGKQCYARKAEWLYPPILPYRERQQEYIESTSIDQMMLDFQDTLKVGRRREKIKFLRLNESGDFQDKEILNKLDWLAEFLKREYNIVTYTYSHRSDMIKDLENCKYINIIGSEFYVHGNITKIFNYQKGYSNIPKVYHICDCRKNSKIKKTCNLDCFVCSKGKGIKLALIKH